MSAVLWMNLPLMVLIFGLIVGIPMWMVLRYEHWHGKPEARTVPAYLTRRPAPVRVALVRVPRSSGYEGHRSMRPLTGDANG